MDSTVEFIYKLIVDNPAVLVALASALVAAGAFFKPIMVALQRALIRRIEQAWPNDSCTSMTHEEKIQHTVAAINKHVPVSRKYLESAVRKHKSNPPPAKADE